MNRITSLFDIQYPIIQGGMIWCSGWELASAVSNAGGLGLIGGGSMDPDTFRHHIRKAKEATQRPFGVNLPLIYPHIQDMVNVVIEEEVKIVFTSAGSPKKYTSFFKEHGIKVAHVIANVKFALKCEEAEVDAIVAEGFEAGGHNGFEETTTMTLIPLVRRAVKSPLIAAGGIGSGGAMLAAMALGAEGVQIGSRFAASEESSAHHSFKQKIIDSKDGDTKLTLRKVIPVRLIKNDFFYKVEDLESKGATAEDLKNLLGRGRARKGMFEGDTVKGELEIGQVSALIDEIKPTRAIVNEIMEEFESVKKNLQDIHFLKKDRG
ncbi:MAG: nitronate monooxygenase [Bacteroidales bacterium]|nr:nitronate monooxygenase [Bacteroidales bacterium]